MAADDNMFDDFESTGNNLLITSSQQHTIGNNYLDTSTISIPTTATSSPLCYPFNGDVLSTSTANTNLQSQSNENITINQRKLNIQSTRCIMSHMI